MTLKNCNPIKMLYTQYLACVILRNKNLKVKKRKTSYVPPFNGPKDWNRLCNDTLGTITVSDCIHYAFIAKCAIFPVNIAFRTSCVVTCESIFTTTGHYYDYIVRVYVLFIHHSLFKLILTNISSIALSTKSKSRTSPYYLFDVF